MCSRFPRMIPLSDVRVCLNFWLEKFSHCIPRAFITSHCNHFFRSLFFPIRQRRSPGQKPWHAHFLILKCPEVPGDFPNTVYWLSNSEWHLLWPGRQISRAHLVIMTNTEQGMWTWPFLEGKGWGCTCRRLEPVGRAGEGLIRTLNMWYSQKWFLPILGHRWLSFCLSRDDCVLITNVCHWAQLSHDASW